MENETTGKRKPLLNVFDIVIILLAAAAAVLFLLWRSGRLTPKEEDVVQNTGTVRYSVEITNLDYGTEEKFQVGDELLDTIRNFALGTVTGVEIRETTVMSRNLETAEYFETTVPDRKTVILTVESPCTESGSAIVVDGGYTIRGGSTINITGPAYYGVGVILFVERGTDR